MFDPSDEMESLNLDELDLTELERRLELAVTGPSCPANGTGCEGNVVSCNPNCSCNDDGIW
jgi:hypothetical protein